MLPPPRPHAVPIRHQLPFFFFQKRTVFLCLPGRVGAAVSGISLRTGPSLPPTQRMPGLDCRLPELPTGITGFYF